MAEQIPYDVASSLINRLASAVFHEFGRIYGVVDELERLKNTVESIRAVLLDAEEKQEQNHAVQNWIRRLKDVLHPADDLVDEFFIQEMKHKVDAHHHHKNKVTEVLHSFSPKQIVSRHKLAGQIEKIRKTFNDVVGEMSMLNLIPNVYDKQTNINERWETTSFIFEPDIIGRIDDKKEIISLLEKPHSHDGQIVSLIAIVGIGGLGKTALAQLVYNDVKVQKSFENKMWVCVSDNFDVKTIVKKMFESLINSKVDDNLFKLERLPFLKSLYLNFLDDLEYIYYEEPLFPVTFFQSLESLTFWACVKFRGWWRIGDDFNNDNYSSHSHHLPLPPFPPRLSQLSIYECPRLTLMPTFPSLDKKLKLFDCSVEILKATINTPFDFPPLSKLKSLVIGGLALEDVRQFPKDWAQNLTTLRELKIRRFSNQQVQEMEIWFKDNLDCLQNISFYSCKELEALPDWMCNLSSLQHIKVDYCRRLKSLPEGMSRLTNLQTLEIANCPLLVEECQTETSATWPQISHIPNIIIRGLRSQTHRG